MVRIKSVHPIPPATLYVEWADGLQGPIDLAEWIATGSGLIAPLKDAAVFATARVGEHGVSVEWGKGGDLAIDAAHLMLKMQVAQAKRPIGNAQFFARILRSSFDLVELPKVTRVEVIDEKGRDYVSGIREMKVSLSFQDDGRTLKVFIDRAAQRSPTRRATHPGAILREDVLPALGLSPEQAAEVMGVDVEIVRWILAETASITPELAEAIGKLAGNGPNLWLRMQENHNRT